MFLETLLRLAEWQGTHYLGFLQCILIQLNEVRSYFRFGQIFVAHTTRGLCMYIYICLNLWGRGCEKQWLDKWLLCVESCSDGTMNVPVLDSSSLWIVSIEKEQLVQDFFPWIWKAPAVRYKTHKLRRFVLALEIEKVWWCLTAQETHADENWWLLICVIL